MICVLLFFSGDVKLQDIYFPIGSVSSTSSEGCAIAWTYYKDNFDYIKEKLSKAFPGVGNVI